MLQRDAGGVFTAEHAGDFLYAGFCLGCADGGDSAVVLGALADNQMVLPEDGDLRQVGDADDLVAAGDFLQLDADNAASSTADVGVDFVEDKDGNGVVFGEYGFDGEHDTCDFTTGGDLRERAYVFAGVGSEAKDDVVSAVGRGVGGFEHDAELCLEKAEVAQGGGDLLGELGGGLLACRGEGGTESGEVFLFGEAVGL